MPIQLTREQWLNEAAGLILDDILPQSVRDGIPLAPETFRISVSPLKGDTRWRAYPRSDSADNRNEIYVSARIADSMPVLGALCHALATVALDCRHAASSATVMSMLDKAGLYVDSTTGEVKPHDGNALASMVEIIQILGPLPHAELAGARAQKGRNNHKLHCSHCGFNANTSIKHARAVEQNNARVCPACDAGASHFTVTIK